MKKDKIYQAIAKAVKFAMSKMTLEEFKKTSFFVNGGKRKK
jgi:hypothetical protein